MGSPQALLFAGQAAVQARGMLDRMPLSVAVAMLPPAHPKHTLHLRSGGAGLALHGGNLCSSGRRVSQLHPPRYLKAPAAGAGSVDFDLTEYYEATVAKVKRTNLGKVVYLKLVEPSGRVLPVYIGDFESEALERQMHNRPTDRPMTHDLMKTTLERLGYKVVRVRVTALMGNTYLARVHYCKLKDSSVDEIDVDARPSDALNLAARFGAPVYVNKEVAIKMGQHFTAAEATPLESPNDVYQSVKDILRQFVDPTTMLKVQLQVCIAEERYGDAAQLRNKIDHLLATDRSLALVVAMESALIDRRYTEAATLRDEYVKLQESRKQGPETQDSSDWQQLQQTQIWPSFNS